MENNGGMALRMNERRKEIRTCSNAIRSFSLSDNSGAGGSQSELGDDGADDDVCGEEEAW